jgi:phosphate-selective porin
MSRKSLRWCLALGVALGAAGGAAGVAGAQGPAVGQPQPSLPVPYGSAPHSPTADEVQLLKQQVQQLSEQLQKMQTVPTAPPVAGAPSNINYGENLSKDDVKKLVADYLKDKQKNDEAAAKAKLDAEGYKVGSDLKVNANWKDGFVWSTANGDFTGHIGGWIQYDNVWFNQDPFLRTAPGARSGPAQKVLSGPAQGGIGDLQDGTYFRRLRLMTDGTFWEQFEYTLIYAFENDQFSTIGLDEFWVGAKDIPLIGTVRIGHVKNAVGLEADMTGSSRTMTFMERSAYSEAIELNQNFVTGVWVGNSYFDQRATSTFVAFRPDQGSSSGAFFGDGQYGLQGRLTALPIDDCDGRHLMHVGVSGGWRNGSNNIASSPFRTLQIRARPELRDDDPAASAGLPQAVPNANSNRMIDTGAIAINNDWLMGLEFLYILGPLSLQAEYGWNWMEDASGVAPAGLVFNPKIAPIRNFCFSGGYVQLAYTLTGENRAYDRRLGRLDTYYFGRQGPYNGAWFVRDHDGNINYSFGAWEVAARYGYVDLNSGTGTQTIQGGQYDTWTLGLNWYLNTNLKFQFDYIYDQRHDLPAGVTPGYVQGLGIRMQFMY